MKLHKLMSGIGFGLVTGLLSFNAFAASSQVLNDPQEITDFLSGYDIKSVTFTIDANDVLSIEIEPYGVPGDADGDGNPDASSNPAIFDEPGVGSTEFINIGLVCADPSVCVPDVNFQYTADTLIVDNPLAGPASMAIVGDAYVLTIPDWTTFKTNLDGNPESFGAFSFSASFTDLQVDDFAPDLDPVTFAPVCEPVDIEPPTPQKDPFDCYGVNRVSVKNKHGTHKDRVKVHKAGFRLDPPNEVDMATDMVQIRIDGLVFDFPPGSFEMKGNKPDFVFKSASGVIPRIRARLRFDKFTWGIRARGIDADLIDKSDGIDVCLMIGNFESCENIVISKYGSHSSSSDSGHRGNRHSCNPNFGNGSSSDSGTPGHNKLSCIGSLTLQHSSGALITKTRAAAELLHPNTVFVDEATGDMAIVNTSCGVPLYCGDSYGNFTIVEIESTRGDKLARRCNREDASCSILP